MHNLFRIGAILVLLAGCRGRVIDYEIPGYVSAYGVFHDGKFGAIDRDGKLLFVTETPHFLRFHEGLAKGIDLDGKEGYLDHTGKCRLALKYKYTTYVQDGIISVGEELLGASGYVDLRGKLIVPIRHRRADLFSEGLAATSFLGKRGFINIEGRTVIAHKYDWVSSFHNGYAAVERNEQHYVIDRSGKELLSHSSAPLHFSEGMFCTTHEYIGLDGKKAIDDYFYGVSSFNSGLAMVSKDLDDRGVVSYAIDKSGRSVFGRTFESATRFQHGYAVVREHGAETATVIDTEGRTVARLPYDPVFSSIDKNLVITFYPHYEDPEIIGDSNNPWYMRVDGTLLWEPGEEVPAP